MRKSSFKITFASSKNDNSKQTEVDSHRLGVITFTGLDNIPVTPDDFKKLGNSPSQFAKDFFNKHLHQGSLFGELASISRLVLSEEMGIDKSKTIDAEKKIDIIEKKEALLFTYSKTIYYQHMNTELAKPFSFDATITIPFNGSDIEFTLPTQRCINYTITAAAEDITQLETNIKTNASSEGYHEAFGHMTYEKDSYFNNVSTFFKSFTVRNPFASSRNTNENENMGVELQTKNTLEQKF